MILAIGLIGFIATADVSPTYDPVLDTEFKCPTEYPDFKAYIAGLFTWNDLAWKRHPDWTKEQHTRARHDLFVKHQCPPPPAQP